MLILHFHWMKQLSGKSKELLPIMTRQLMPSCGTILLSWSTEESNKRMS